AKRDRRDVRRLRRALGIRAALAMRVDDDVHVPLPIEKDLARAMPGDRAKAHHLEHVSKRLRLARRVFDELDAVEPERVPGGRDRFAIGQLHQGLQAAASVAAAYRSCRCYPNPGLLRSFFPFLAEASRAQTFVDPANASYRSRAAADAAFVDRAVDDPGGHRRRTARMVVERRIPDDDANRSTAHGERIA